MILAIETSTRAFSIYMEEEEMHVNLEIVYFLTHSQSIVQSVDFLLKRINRKVEDISEIYAGLGPGSFTGIRVGLSFVNTLSQVLKVPLAGASTLDILSFEVDNWKTPIVSFIKSRRDEVFTSFYEDGKRLDEYKVLKIEDFIEYISNKRPGYLISSEKDFRDIVEPLFNSRVNSGTKSLIESIEKIYSYPKAKYIPSVLRHQGMYPDMKYLKPLYVRGF